MKVDDDPEGEKLLCPGGIIEGGRFWSFSWSSQMEVQGGQLDPILVLSTSLFPKERTHAVDDSGSSPPDITKA